MVESFQSDLKKIHEIVLEIHANQDTVKLEIIKSRQEIQQFRLEMKDAFFLGREQITLMQDKIGLISEEQPKKGCA